LGVICPGFGVIVQQATKGNLVMGHNLAKIGGKTAMFYYGEPPWHRLGVQLEKPATASEAIKSASLDWEVVKMPLHLKAGDRFAVAKDSFAIVRADSRTPDIRVFKNVRFFRQEGE